MPYKDLVIINNEKISEETNSFYCDNVDMKSIPEDLSKNFKVKLIARNSKIRRTHKINLAEIKTSSNIISFLYNILKTIKNNKSEARIIQEYFNEEDNQLIHIDEQS